MVKNRGHIDLVFRNGLKDLEVLPPCDLWEGISPALRARRERISLLKVAAGLAAIISLSVFAFVSGSRLGSTQPNLADLGREDLSSEIMEYGFGESTPKRLLAASSSDQGADAVTEIEPSVDLVPGSERKDFKKVNFVNSNSGSLVNILQKPVTKTASPEALEAAFLTSSDLESFRNIDLAENPVSINRWKIGARVSPTYLSSNLKAANQNLSELGQNESAVMSYTGGVALSYSMGSRLSLQTGVYYSSLGREISGISSYSGFGALAGSKSGRVFGIETTTGLINTTNKDIFLSDVAAQRIQSIYTSDLFDPIKANLTPFGTSLKQNFEYLEIPVMLSFKLIDRRFDFNLHGGVSYNFLLNNKTYAIGEESVILLGSTEDINKLLLSSALGMSVEYSLTNRFSFNIEPSLRYYLNNNGRLSVDNSYTLGIYSGLFFKF